MSGTATPAQIQNFADTRVRVHAEAARALAQEFLDDINVISDVYTALTGTGTNTSTWTDTRSDNPPHLLQQSDILSFNTFIHDISNAITAHPQYPIILAACVRPISQGF